MARFVRISAAGGGARRSRRHRPPRGRQPMTSLQWNGVRSQPAVWRSMRGPGPVSSRTLASPAPGGGAVAFHVPQWERRSANTRLPADLPTKAPREARRPPAPADTASFPVGVHASPAIGTRGECLDRRNKVNAARTNLQARDQAIESGPHPGGKSAGREAEGRGSGVAGLLEDVPDETDGAIRRVHWTITKRTVADQQSGKPMTTAYVLKRDGVDTEFPSLGTARMAANKTIVHPEKLTLSKAEHAAARK